MGTIAKADFILLADSIAAQSYELDQKLGTGIEAATASLGATNNIARIVAYADAEVIDDLIEGFRNQLAECLSIPVAFDRFVTSMRALSRHVGGMSAYLVAQDERVGPDFKVACEMLAIEILTPAATFSPVVPAMGEITIDAVDPPGGAGASSTFVDGSAIDITRYYASNLVLEKTTAAVAADALTLTVSCTKWDTTSEDKDVPVDASDAINNEDDIGVHGTDMYTDITDIVIKAGSEPTVATTINQKWKGKSEVERVIDTADL